MAPLDPQQSSSTIYQRLIRGEATSQEYVSAVKREVAEAMRVTGPGSPRGDWIDKLARQCATWQWLAFAGWMAFLLTVFAAVVGWL